jgi:hypothetical protein
MVLMLLPSLHSAVDMFFICVGCIFPRAGRHECTLEDALKKMLCRIQLKVVSDSHNVTKRVAGVVLVLS